MSRFPFLFTPLLLIIACRNDGLDAARIAQQSGDLFVVKGATNVHSTVRTGVERVTYDVRARYPAENIVLTIGEDLHGRGWRPLRNNWFNRDDTSSYVRGWIQLIAGSQRFPPR